MAQNVSKVTTDHDAIRRWAEERGGTPTAVEGTARGRGDAGIIRIDFPGYSGEGRLHPISWDEWFEKFEGSGLAFVYEDETAGGQRSNFNKLVSRERARASGRDGARSARARGRGTGRARQARAGGRRQAARAEAARSTRSKRGRKSPRAGTSSRTGSRTGSRSSSSRSRSKSKSRSRSRSRSR
jgi:hypothetical protein